MRNNTTIVERKLEALNAHLAELTDRHGHMELHISFCELVTAISTMQLALRHPGYRDDLPNAWRQSRALVDTLIEHLDERSPGIGALLREADDPTKDV